MSGAATRMCCTKMRRAPREVCEETRDVCEEMMNADVLAASIQQIFCIATSEAMQNVGVGLMPMTKLGQGRLTNFIGMANA